MIEKILRVKRGNRAGEREIETEVLDHRRILILEVIRYGFGQVRYALETFPSRLQSGLTRHSEIDGVIES